MLYVFWGRPCISPRNFLALSSRYQLLYTTTISHTMSNLAAFVEAQKGQIVVHNAYNIEFGDGEVLVKVQACSIQPADAKVAELAMVTVEYTAILGSPVAGVVESVGGGITTVAVVKRVVSGTKIFTHKKAKYGRLQRFSTVDASDVVEVSGKENTSIRVTDPYIVAR
jgi:NADPH:quinone reductase-like Zn-dependent oxidoreductase